MRFSSVAFELPYLLIELFFIGVPVMPTDGRSVCGHVITKFSRIGMGNNAAKCTAHEHKI